MDDKQKEKLIIQDLLLVAIGASGLSVSLFTGLLGAYAFITMFCGVALMILGTFDAARLFNKTSVAENIIENKQGLIWIWIVGFLLAIPMAALIYFVLDYPFDIIVSTVAPIYTFTGVTALAWTATQVVIDYLLAFVVIMVVLWVVTNAKSPQGYYQ